MVLEKYTWIVGIGHAYGGFNDEPDQALRTAIEGIGPPVQPAPEPEHEEQQDKDGTFLIEAGENEKAHIGFQLPCRHAIVASSREEEHRDVVQILHGCAEGGYGQHGACR